MMLMLLSKSSDMLITGRFALKQSKIKYFDQGHNGDVLISL